MPSTSKRPNVMAEVFMPILRSSSRSTMAYSVSYASTRNILASHKIHAVQPTLPVTAANAITMPKLNAMPKKACGIAKKRLVKG